MSGNCQWKNLVREKLPKQIVNCIFVSIQVFSRSLLCLKSIWFRIMYCCIPTPTTDSNTSTGMIWVTLNMPSAAEEQRSAANRQGNVRESSGNFTLSGEWTPCLLFFVVYVYGLFNPSTLCLRKTCQLWHHSKQIGLNLSVTKNH